MSNQGKIVQIIGAVVDVEFPRDNVPKVYDALKVQNTDITLEVQQQLGDGVVRTIALGSTAAFADKQAVTVVLNAQSPMTQGMAMVLANVKSVSASSTHALAVTQDGKLYGWGNAQFGNMGEQYYGDSANYWPDTPVLILDGVQAAAAGDTRPARPPR